MNRQLQIIVSYQTVSDVVLFYHSSISVRSPRGVVRDFNAHCDPILLSLLAFFRNVQEGSQLVEVGAAVAMGLCIGNAKIVGLMTIEGIVGKEGMLAYGESVHIAVGPASYGRSVGYDVIEIAV